MRGFSSEEVEKLEKSKSLEVQKLLSLYKDILKNPAFDSLITFRVQKNKWQQEIQNNPASLFSAEEGKANKDFEYAMRFLEAIAGLAAIEETLVKKLTPEEIKEVDNKVNELSQDDFAGQVEFIGETLAKERNGKRK
jgi:hypothetical protein